MQWADYSGGRPSAAALKAAGFGGVIRYIGMGGTSKRITAAEYRDLAAGGVQVLLVVERMTDDAWGTDTDDDFARGVQFGQAGLAEARALGIPDSVGMACAADAHALAYQIDDVQRFATGFASVLGKARAGFYGFQETLAAVRASGAVSWYWRCGSEPTTAEQTWTHLWQRNQAPTNRIVSSVICDINEQYLPIGDDMWTQALIDELFNRLKWLETGERTVINQVTGDPKGDPSFDTNGNWVTGHLPGFPSLVDGKHYTPADTLRLVDLHTCQENDLDKQILAVVKGVATGNVDVAALATALQNTLAPEIVKALGAKLVS